MAAEGTSALAYLESVFGFKIKARKLNEKIIHDDSRHDDVRRMRRIYI